MASRMVSWILGRPINVHRLKQFCPGYSRFLGIEEIMDAASTVKISLNAPLAPSAMVKDTYVHRAVNFHCFTPVQLRLRGGARTAGNCHKFPATLYTTHYRRLHM